MLSAALADEHHREMLEAAAAAYPVRSTRHHARAKARRLRGRSLAVRLRSR
ncbi:MAG: hypothetical protein ACJ74O_20335 [Frankiaceae bacterium]